jgi:hypothetical protein
VNKAAKNFTGVCSKVTVNYGMIRRAVAVAAGVMAVCFSVQAQQPGVLRAFDRNFSLGVSDPGIFWPTRTSLLFHNDRVRPWSDGGRLVGETAFANISMGLFDLFPASYFTTAPTAPSRRTTAPSDAPSQNFGTDGKDLPEQAFNSPLNGVYYGGEIGFLYGRWSGKGGGDMIDTYILGTVGNEHFQITAGAEYEEWSGRGARSRSFIVPR